MDRFLALRNLHYFWYGILSHSILTHRVLHLDLPRWFCLWSVIRRVVTTYGRSRPDLGPGCPEKFDIKFLLYVWNYPRRNRPAVLQKLSDCREEQTVRIFHSRREAYTFLERTQRDFC